MRIGFRGFELFDEIGFSFWGLRGVRRRGCYYVIVIFIFYRVVMKVTCFVCGFGKYG